MPLLYISIINIILAILISIFNWNRNKTSTFLALFLLTMSIYGLAHYFVVYGNNPYWLAFFYNHFTPTNLLTGPFLYFYIRGTLNDKNKITKGDLLHFLLPLVHFIGIIPYLLIPFQQKLEISNSIIENLDYIHQVDTNFIFSVEAAFFIRPIMLLGYCLSCIFLIWKNAYEGKLIKDVPSKQFRVTRRWLVILISNVLIMTLNFLYLTIVFADTSASETITNTNNLYYATGFLFCLMALGLLFFPQVLYGMPRYKENEELLENEEKDGQKNINYSKENSQKNNTVTDNEPFLELANRIEEYVAREKPYTNPDFSIEDLAKGLLVPLNHVSYCLSNVMNTKFTSYRMQLRIEFAKELLKSGKNQEFTIEGIAKQAGFSTRSNFYSAFKAETGYTPTEYMKKSFL